MDAAAGLAGLLHTLKHRSRRSYATLAARTGVSTSALHRYCTGQGLPPDFGIVARLGAACGTDRRELSALHRRWLVETSLREDGPPLERDRPRTSDPLTAIMLGVAAGVLAGVGTSGILVGLRRHRR